MNFRQQERPDVSIEITSLIDVIFMMLLFFMITTNFVSAPGIKVQLPKTSTQESLQEKKDVTIVVAPNQKIFLNDNAVNLSELKQKLGAIAAETPTTLVIIRADTQVPHGEVVQVMDIARELGLTRLAIATEPKS